MKELVIFSLYYTHKMGFKQSKLYRKQGQRWNLKVEGLSGERKEENGGPGLYPLKNF